MKIVKLFFIVVSFSFSAIAMHEAVPEELYGGTLSQHEYERMSTAIMTQARLFLMQLNRAAGKAFSSDKKKAAGINAVYKKVKKSYDPALKTSQLKPIKFISSKLIPALEKEDEHEEVVAALEAWRMMKNLIKKEGSNCDARPAVQAHYIRSIAGMILINGALYVDYQHHKTFSSQAFYEDDFLPKENETCFSQALEMAHRYINTINS